MYVIELLLGVVPDIVPPGVFVVGEEVLLLIVTIILPVTVVLVASFAVTVIGIEDVIGSVELPDTTPVVGFIINPAGSVGAENCVNPIPPVGDEVYTVDPVTPLIGAYVIELLVGVVDVGGV